MNDFEIKAPQDAVIPDPLPQERITGDVLRGYGPRRGNLERLLRYWRPIMKKPGGFRRCRVILANHPELYPLENICAWLHHETTGLWPNEGCHHPGMKNCRGKLKKRNWSDADFGQRLARRLGQGKKDAQGNYDFFFSDFLDVKDDWGSPEYPQVVTTTDVKHAFAVLADFVEMEPNFSSYLRDNNNWEIVGESPAGEPMSAPFKGFGDCGCN